MFDFHGKIADRMLLTEASAGFHPISYAAPLFGAAPPAGWQMRVKRGLDVALALIALTLFSWLLLGIALLVRLDSPGPALFRQRRIGRDGQMFELLKFRTMRQTPAIETLRQATRDDPRITRLGGWLRRTSLDELPQFINVLRGEMSVVGPRPHAPGTRAGGRLFEDIAPHYGQRHRALPGITGLAQVRGWRGETDTELKLLRRLDSDLEYIESWSLTLDLAIILRTVPMVARMLNAY